MKPVELLIFTMQNFLPGCFMVQEQHTNPDIEAFKVYPNRQVLPLVSLPLEIPRSYNLMSDQQIVNMLEPKVRWLKAAFLELEINDPMPFDVDEPEKTEEMKAEEKIEQSRASLVGAAPWIKI